VLRPGSPRFARGLSSGDGSPKHWSEDADREPTRPRGPPELEELKCWIRRVLSPTSHVRLPEHERMRGFWADQERKVQKQVCGVGTNWSLFPLAGAVFSRPVPRRATAKYFGFSSAVTCSFMYLTWLPESAAEPWLIDQAAHVVRHMMESHGLMQSLTGFVATALFMTLSFNMNRAAKRWWQGRELCGDVIRHVHTLSQTSQLSVSNKGMAVELGLLGYGFARAAEFHVRQEPDAAYRKAFGALLPKDQLEALLLAPHRPYFFSERLTLRLSDAYDAGHVKNVRLAVALQANVDRLIDAMEGFERIRSTPEPWSHQRLLRFLAQLWLGMLPLVMVPTLQVATPVLSSAIAYVVYKLDDVAVEISVPFGYDKSDLNVCLLNDRLQLELLSSQLTFLDWTPSATAVLGPSEEAQDA